MMTTLLIAVLFVLAFGVSLETRFTLPKVFIAGRGTLKIGKLAFVGIVYRPGRCYARIGAM